MTEAVVDSLLNSGEPALRYKTLTKLLKKDASSAEMQALQGEIKTSPRVQALLAERTPDGKIPYHPYSKWFGANWVLAILAELEYPPGDAGLLPLREQELDYLLQSTGEGWQARPKLLIGGRVRSCASIEGNAIFSLLRLGLADDRIEALVEGLLSWQWEDGGWNCDHQNPGAHHSSFMETLIPMRALALYGQISGAPRALRAVERAAEVFLKRHLYKRQSNGEVIRKEFVRFSYPRYWHYDILFGLVVMSEAGMLADPRCQDALDLLESKRLADGGFPVETKYYNTNEKFYRNGKRATGYSLVDWGGTGVKKMNPWVTADALIVLKAAGRL
jgi:hypothetical protein